MTGARIVVLGATGYTGTLLSRALVDRGAQPILAGRSPEKLKSLATTLGGLETHSANVFEPGSIRKILAPGDVLVSTVGPFQQWGDAAVQAAIDSRATYLDSCGEPAFIRRVFEKFGPSAHERSTALLPASGFDWVPGNLAGALALTGAGHTASRIEISYLLDGTGVRSRGARASAVGALLAPSFAYRNGRVIAQRTAARARRVPTGTGRPRWALSAGGTEHLALPELFPHLRDVDVALGLYGAASSVVPCLSAAAAVTSRVAPAARAVRSALDHSARRPVWGPSDEARAAGSASVIARAYSTSHHLLDEYTLSGVEGFTFTANFLAWASILAAAGQVRARGVLGPVQAFGIYTLTEGVRLSGLR